MFFNRPSNLTQLKSYTLGLHHAKAQRVIHQTMAAILKQWQLNPLDWILLGLLSEHDQGLRPSQIATQLGVEAPLITVLLQQLHHRKWLMRKSDSQDKRASVVSLTASGRRHVVTIEKKLDEKINHLIEGSTPQELTNYLKVVQTITAQ